MKAYPSGPPYQLRINHILLALALTVLPPAIGMSDEMTESRDLELQPRELATKLRDGEIVGVDIFQVPTKMLTRARLTPETLDRRYYHRLTIHNLRYAARDTALANAMTSLAVRASTDRGDIRWGLVFYGSDGQRVGSVYMDGSGQKGYINSHIVAFGKNTVFDWLRKNFGRCFD